MNLLTEHLAIWTGADNEKKSGRGRASGSAASVYGVKKLRELILELAVRGKLVPQDASDEPASELLKRIEAEKAKLIKEGKIKAQKPLAEIGDDEKPFDLPMGWEWARLGEITNFGTTVKPNGISDQTWVLDLEDIEKDTSKLLQKIRFSERGSLSDKNSFIAGDVLYGKLRPYLNKVIVADESGVCTTEIFPVRCFGSFDSYYFMFALKSPYFIEYVNARSYGMKMPRLGTEDGRKACFPLPPLAEQHRIVAKVDELMTLCDQLENQHSNAIVAHEKLVSYLLNTLTQTPVRPELVVLRQAQHERGDFNLPSVPVRPELVEGLYGSTSSPRAELVGSPRADEFAESWQRIAANFDTLFNTESSIDALKQTVLQLAVMGKLVPQDVNDEPASELLKRIQTEKAKLIAEGKIKKDKPLAAIADDEKPFELPKGWEWARLSDVATKITDGTHHTPTYVESGIPFLSVKDMSSGLIDFSSTRFISLEEHELLTKRCNPQIGDLLLTKVGTTGIPVVVSTDRPFSIFVSVALIKAPWSLIDVEYLQRLISSPFVKKQSDEGTEGVGNKNLVLRKISEFYLAIPPLAEQHRIVAKVDELMAICDQLKTRITTANQLQQKLADVLVGRAVA